MHPATQPPIHPPTHPAASQPAVHLSVIATHRPPPRLNPHTTLHLDLAQIGQLVFPSAIKARKKLTDKLKRETASKAKAKANPKAASDKAKGKGKGKASNAKGKAAKKKTVSKGRVPKETKKWNEKEAKKYFQSLKVSATG